MTKKNIIILALVFAFLAILFLLDWPAYNKATLLKDEVKRHQQLLAEQEELLIKVNQLKQVYESHKNEIKKVYYVLPLEKDIPNLIVQFEALASENGLILEGLDFVEPIVVKKRRVAAEEKLAVQEKPKPYKQLDVSLKLSGSYQSFKSFLGALEYNVRLMDIESINFSSEKKETEEVEGAELFSFDVSLKVYYQ